MHLVSAKTRRGVRPLLLVLLWVWAGCLFGIVDLFWNVEEFDAVRPRSDLYQGMRKAAHRLVGEDYEDQTIFGPLRPLGPSEEDAHLALERIHTACRERSFGELEHLALHHLDPAVRAAALRGLAFCFGPQARETLFFKIGEDLEEPDVRREAARLLGVTGDEAAELIAELLESDLPGWLKAGAVLGLGELQTGPAFAQALAQAASGQPELREAALQAIARMGRAEVRAQVVAAAEDAATDPGVRIAACTALGRAGDGLPIASLAFLVGDADASEEVQQAAAQALATLAERADDLPLAPDELRRIVREEVVPERRTAALAGLVDRAGAAAQEDLLRLVHDTDEPESARREAARLLGRTGPKGARLLDGLLRSELPEIIAAGAVLGLAEVDSEGAAEQLVELAQGPSPLLRASALRAIECLEPGPATGVLAGVAGDETSAVSVRVAACRALGRSGLPAGREALTALLEEDDAPRAVRAAAVDALGRLGDDQSLAAIASVLQEEDIELQERAWIAWKRVSPS